MKLGLNSCWPLYRHFSIVGSYYILMHTLIWPGSPSCWKKSVSFKRLVLLPLSIKATISLSFIIILASKASTGLFPPPKLFTYLAENEDLPSLASSRLKTGNFVRKDLDFHIQNCILAFLRCMISPTATAIFFSLKTHRCLWLLNTTLVRPISASVLAS